MEKVFSYVFLLLFLLVRLTPITATSSSCNPLYVAAFNIQIFGVTKASKSDIMSVLANITLRYDIMLVLEIRDIGMTAIYQLLDLVNSIAPDGDSYGMALSDRTGRSSSKEQYSFFYRASRVSVVSTHQFNDTEGDYFEREPFSVLFRHNCSNSSAACEEFWLQAIHTKPTEAVSEIDSLYRHSFPDASAAFSSPRGMLLGDLNADCSYVSNSAALSLEFSLDSGFSFLLAKGEIDTTVSSTYCTYDNFVVPSNFSSFVKPGSARIFNFMTAYSLTLDFSQDVSDHFPIELVLDIQQCTTVPTIEPTPDPFDMIEDNCTTLKVAAFNIQIFGVTKASKSDVMYVLANITLRYDIMLVLEIRDISMTAIYQLLDLVNSVAPDGDSYGMALSDRTGRSSSKEQYSFFYRASRVSVVSTHQFNDTEGDYFEREPFSVLFRHNCSNSSAACEEFWLQAIHTKPTEAVSEIDSLYRHSFPDASAAFSSPRGMLLGDLNADCSYVSNSAALSLEFSLDSGFSFLLAKGEIDTTVSSTYCTYDNFVVPSNFSSFVKPGSARIFNFMTAYGLTLDFAKDVSDHFPIELVLDIEQCTTVPTIEPTPDPFDMIEDNCTTLKVAAFNIQIFGVTKASKSDVMSVLANITLRYDIMLVLEIRDIGMTAIYQLLDLVNSIAPDGDSYGMALSDRTGRSSSKEQYSFFYRASRVSVVSTHQFNDTEGDYFEREPFSVLFRHNCSNSSAACEEFWLQAIHTKPTEAVSEIDSLYRHSFPDASAAFSSPRGMLLGDLNADCSYVSNSAALSLEFSLDSGFSFLLAKGEIDTTVSSTYCTYDNFVVPSNFSSFVKPGSARIFNFMTAYSLTLDFSQDVSDHFPIELVLDIQQCTTVPTIEPTPDPFDMIEDNCTTLKVAAFNIQIFGVTKASKSDVMYVLANITLRYDIMLVLEIRDISMTAIYQLLDLVNSVAPDGDSYGMALSDRTGRSSSKEQYSFFYRASRVSVVSTHQFNDTEGDYFEREPFSVLFRHNCSNSSAACEEFWLQAIHTKPTEAVSEIDSLYRHSFPDASAAFSSPRGMLLGDLNADCSYVSNSAALSLEFSLDSGFSFLLAKGEIDTTVSSTYCTYDNFVVPSNFSSFVKPGSARIFNFMTAYGLTLDFAKDVSDHFPIELEVTFPCNFTVVIDNLVNGIELSISSMLLVVMSCFIILFTMC